MKNPTSANKRRRLRLLILAYACSPYQGSEPGIGWHRAVEGSRIADTWVICEKNEFYDDIQRYLNQNGRIPGLHFCFVPKTRREEILTGIPGMYYISYNLWHRRAFLLAEKLHLQLRFDIVHQA